LSLSSCYLSSVPKHFFMRALKILGPVLTKRWSSTAVSSKASPSAQATRQPACQMANMMDVGSRRIWDADHDIFRESTRRFMREELIPMQAEFEAAGLPTRDIWKKIGQQGLLGLDVPMEMGGLGGSFKHEAILMEEQIYAQVYSPNLVVQNILVIPYFKHYASQEQRERFLPRLISGEVLGCIGMTEPDAGSDLQGIRTFAKKSGDDFVLNGSKVFISNGINADLHIVVAVTNPHAKSKAHGISLLLVERDMEGFKKGKNLKKLGLKGQDTAELFFEDVRVPKENVLGPENHGFYQLMQQLSPERLAIAIGSVGSCEWMFEETRQYVNERKAFGRTLSGLQTVQHKMAEMKTAISVCRSFVDECIELQDEGKLDPSTASMAKYWATELDNKIASECLQLHGGWGFMSEQAICKAYANARVATIYGGANEIMKELIARDICK